MDDPLFRSVHAALSFAYNVSAASKLSAINSMMGGPKPRGRGLGGLDGAAQAGMIQAEVRQLPGIQPHILAARYLSPTKQCACRSPCCQGYRENQEWSEAVDAITKETGRLFTVSQWHMRRGIITRFAGGRASIVDLANRCGLSKSAAYDMNSKLTDYLREQMNAAHWTLEGNLKAKGMLE